MDGTLSPPVAEAVTREWESIAGIERWICAHIARATRLPESDIEVGQPFSHYALDSVATVELTADLEDWLELRLPPTLLWDYPTVAALARHLHGLKAHTQ